MRTTHAPAGAGKTVDDFLRTAEHLDALAPTPEALLAEVAAQAVELRFETFGLDTAWRIGTLLRAVAAERSLPLAIDIVVGQQVAFHAALPGSSADNDAWARRKGAVVDRYVEPSLAVGLRMGLDYDGFDTSSRLPLADFAAEGGAFPLLLSTGVSVGHVAVSGLPSIHDHALVVAALRAVIAEDREARP